MSADPYSADVRRLCAAPAHAGDPDDGFEIRIDDQGVRISLAAACDGDTIRALRFRAWGCPHFIASAEAFCSTYEGRPVTELGEFDAVSIMRSLTVPVEKTGRILVLEDAVRALAERVAKGSDPSRE